MMRGLVFLGLLLIATPAWAQGDLVIEGLTVSPARPVAGSAVSVDYRVANRGTKTVPATAQAPYRERIYLSTVNQFDESAVPLGQSHGHTEDLSPGEVHGHPVTVTIPATIPSGEYFVLVQADMDRRFSELNEENNVSVTPLTVAGGGSPPPQPPPSSAKPPTWKATYQSLSVYWQPTGGSAANRASVLYRRVDEPTWRHGHDLWVVGT